MEQIHNAQVDPHDFVTPLRASYRKLPIVLVPGIMGSRLTLNRKITWSPMGTPMGSDPGNMWISPEIEDMDTPHVPDQWNTHPKGSKEHAERSKFRYAYEIVWDPYSALLLDLEKHLRQLLAIEGWEPLIYCCGYDWRRSNMFSADRLQKRVREAVDAAGGEKAVLICHSMGGLVARYFMRSLGGESLVRGCALLGSPTLGAPEAYGMIKGGIGYFQFPQAGIMAALGRVGPLMSREFFRKLASAYELLPHSIYPRSNWLIFDYAQTGYALNYHKVPPDRTGPEVVGCTNSDALYFDPFTGFMDNPDDRQTVRQMMVSRAAFNMNAFNATGKKAYVHPNTFMASSRGHETVVEGVLDNLRPAHFEKRPNNDIAFGTIHGPVVLTQRGPRLIWPRLKKAKEGDETVPEHSAKPLPQLLTSAPRYFAGATEKHGEICGDRVVINTVRGWIYSLLPP